MSDPWSDKEARLFLVSAAVLLVGL